MSASTLRWPLFALIGLLVAVAVALLANQLVSERIGISSEPLTVGQSLSPKQAHREPRRHRRSEAPARTSTGSAHTGAVSDGASPVETPSDRSQADDSKLPDRLGTTRPATPTPTPEPSTSGGSDSSTGPERGDD